MRHGHRTLLDAATLLLLFSVILRFWFGCVVVYRGKRLTDGEKRRYERLARSRQLETQRCAFSLRFQTTG